MAARSIRSKGQRSRRVSVRLSLDTIHALKFMAAEKLNSDVDLSRSLPNMIAVALDYALWERHKEEVLERRRAMTAALERSAKERREILELENLYRLGGKD